MAGITLTQAQTQLDAWLAANIKTSANQSYTIGDRTLTRADAREILAQIDFWDKKVRELTAATEDGTTRRGIIFRGVTPV